MALGKGQAREAVNLARVEVPVLRDIAHSHPRAVGFLLMAGPIDHAADRTGGEEEREGHRQHETRQEIGDVSGRWPSIAVLLSMSGGELRTILICVVSGGKDAVHDLSPGECLQ